MKKQKKVKQVAFSMGVSLCTVVLTMFSSPRMSTCVCQAVGHAPGALILSLSRQGLLFLAAVAALGARMAGKAWKQQVWEKAE